jgi:hypothetical protein
MQTKAITPKRVIIVSVACAALVWLYLGLQQPLTQPDPVAQGPSVLCAYDNAEVAYVREHGRLSPGLSALGDSALEQEAADQAPHYYRYQFGRNVDSNWNRLTATAGPRLRKLEGKSISTTIHRRGDSAWVEHYRDPAYRKYLPSW